MQPLVANPMTEPPALAVYFIDTGQLAALQPTVDFAT